MGINLGAAVFQLGIDAGNLASGLSEASANISGFAGKSYAPLKNVSSSFTAVGENVSGLTQRMERWSRGIRDVPPVVQRAQEAVYSYQSEQKRLAESIEYSKKALEDQIKASAIYADVTQRRQALLNTLVAKEAELQQKYDATLTRQQNLTASLATMSQEIVNSTTAIGKLTADQMALGSAMTQTEAICKRLETDITALSGAEMAAEANIAQWSQELAQATNQIKYHTMEMGKLTKAGQQNSAAYQQHKADADALRQKVQQLNGDLQQEAAKYQGITQALGNANGAYAQETSKLAGIQNAHANVTNKLTDEENKLNDLKHQYDQTDKEINAVNASLNTQTKYMQFASAKIQEQSERVERAKRAEELHAQSIEVAKRSLLNKENAMQRLNNALDLAKERLSQVTNKEKEKKDALDKGTAATKKMKDAEDAGAKAGDQFAKATQNVSFSLFNLGGSAQAAQGQVGALGGTMHQMSIIAGATVLGNAITSLAGNFIGLGQSALGSYVSFEQTGAMLTSLVAKEKMAADKTLDMGKAMDMSKGEAKELQGWMQKLAIESPFSEEDVKGAFSQAMAYNFTSSQAQRLTSALMNMAAATGQGQDAMNRASLALGQMHSLGRVTTEDMNQLTGAGIQVRQILAREFGVSTNKLQEMVTNGLIPADKAIQAITSSLENDFGAAAKNQANTMGGLIASFHDLMSVNLRNFFSSTFDVAKDKLVGLVTLLQSDAVSNAIQYLGNLIGSALGGAIDWLTNTAIPAAQAAFTAWKPTIEDVIAFFIALGQTVIPQVISTLQTFSANVYEAVSYLSGLANDAYSWGSDLIGQFADGIMSGLEYIYDAVAQVGEEIAYWLEPHSPPKILPEIDDWGRQTMQLWADALGDIDFGSLDDISGRVQTFLGQMVSLGQEEQTNVIPTVLNVRDAMTLALQEFEKTGTVGEDTFAMLRDSAGSAGEMVEGYARSLFAAKEASEAVAEAQTELNDAAAQYDEQLSALQKQLDALNRQQESGDDAKKKARLEAMLQGDNTTGADRDKIREELEAMAIKEKIAATQDERDVAVSAAQDKLDAAKAAQDAADKQLKVQQDLLAVQSQQNEMIAKQAELLQRLAEQQEKAAKASGKSGGAGTQEDQAAREAKEAADAQFQYQMSIADTDEKLRLLNEKLATQQVGSKDYFATLKQIDQVKKEQSKTDLQNQQAQTDYNMSLADADDRLKILREEQGKYQEGSKEYLDLQKQIDKVEEVKNKKAEEAKDAQWDYNYSVADTGKKLDMLHEKLSKTTEGSKEYYDTLKQINQLENQAERGGGRKKKEKGDIDPGKFDGLKKEPRTKDDDITSGPATLGGALSNISGKIAEFQQKIGSVIETIKQYSGVLEILGKIALAVFLQKVAGPYIREGLMILRILLTSLFSPLGLLIGVIAALGVAWYTNFGNIREITASVWGRIQGPLKAIGDAMAKVFGAFQSGGFTSAFDELGKQLPAIGASVGQILGQVWQGIVEWGTKLGPILGELIGKAFGAIVGFLAPYVVPIVQALGGFVATVFASIGAYLVTAVPVWGQYIADLFDKIGQWFAQNGSMIFTALRLGIVAAVAGLAEVLVPTLVFLLKRVVDVASWLVPLIPDLIAGVLNLISNLIGWIIGRGVPLLVSALFDLFQYVLQQTSRILPGFGLNLGKALGSILSNLISSILVGLGALIYQLIVAIQNGSLKKALGSLAVGLGQFLWSLLKGIAGFVVGFILGLVEPLVDVGRALIIGLGDGFTGGVADFIRRVVAGFDMTIAWIKNLLGIHSPSTVFAEIGMALIQGLWQGVQAIWDFFAGGLTTKITQMVNGAIALFNSFREGAIFVFNALAAALTGTISSLANDVRAGWNTLWADVKAAAGTAWDNVQKLFTAAKLALLVTVLELKLKAIETVAALASKVVETFNDLKGKMNTAIEGAKNLVLGVIKSLGDRMGVDTGEIRDRVTRAFDKLKENVGGAIEGAKRVVLDTLGSLVRAITDPGGTIKDILAAGSKIGEEIVNGIKSGFASMWDTFTKWVHDQIMKLPAAVRTALGISSPSKVFAEIGRNAMMGLEVGMSDRMTNALATSEQLTNRLISATRGGVSVAVQATPIKAGEAPVSKTEINQTMHVHTQATTPTVVHDFQTMRALASAAKV